LWSSDLDSVVLAGAGDLAWYDPFNYAYGDYCMRPPNLDDLFDLDVTYSAVTPWESQPCTYAYMNYPAWYFNEVGSSQFVDDLMYLLVRKSVPAGETVTFTLAYSLSAASFETAVSTLDAPSSPVEVPLPSGLVDLINQPVATTTTTTTPTTVPGPTTTVPPSTVAPVTPTALPVLIAGELPQLPAGDVAVLENGAPVSVNVFVDNDTELVVQASTFELRLAGDCTNGCTIDTTDDGREVLTLEEQGLANVNGAGFQPGSPVDVWLFSEPRYLGQLTVNADGTFQGDVALGDIDPGLHTLQVNGLSSEGAQRSANLGVVVNPNQAPTPGPGVLPATGTDHGTALWWMILTLLGLGAVITRTARRPHRARH
jgi:hypothetical protein